MGISFSWSLKFIIFFMKCFEGLETEKCDVIKCLIRLQKVDLICLQETMV